MQKPPNDLGALAVSMGWITREALDEALVAQKNAPGKGLRLGQILVERKLLSPTQLRALLTFQGKGIVVCPGCKRQYNAAAFKIGASVKCPSCGALFAVTGAPVQDPGVDGTVILLEGDLNPEGENKTEIRKAEEKVAVPRSFGKYQVVDEIARGGMGIVYRATEMGLGRTVALKVLIAGEEAGQDQIDRFIREARSAAKLRHPNVVPIHDVGVEHGHHYFTMDLIEGCSVEHLLRERIAIQPADALRIARDVAYALQYAHEHGIIHRDLKPGNILLEFSGGQRTIPKNDDPKAGDSNRFTDSDPGTTRKGLFQLKAEDRVYLTDFGLAKEVGGESTRLTRTGMTMGTPAYMSPEQARGRIEEVDARSDVFALGTVLYEMIAGRPPFRGDSIIDVMMRVASKDPPAIRQINPQIHPDIETICLKALEKDKSRRYASALAMAADIESYLGGEAISARPQSLAYRGRRLIRRNAGVVGAVSVTALAISFAFLIPIYIRPMLAGMAEVRQARAAAEAQQAHDAKVEDEARALVRQAEDLALRGQFQEGIAAATSAAITYPAPAVVPEAWFEAGKIQAQLDAGRDFLDATHDQAYRFFALAYETGSDTEWGPRALLAIGRRLEERHDHARAAAVFQRLLQRYPDAERVLDARVGLARALSATGRPDQSGAILNEGDPPPLTSSLRALLAPFGRLSRDPLGAPFLHAALRASGGDPELILVREGELLTVKWPSQGPMQVEHEALASGEPLDVVEDGRDVRCILREGGALRIATRFRQEVASLPMSWAWRGGRAACADLDGDGTPELYLPLGDPEPCVARLEGAVACALPDARLAGAETVDLVPLPTQQAGPASHQAGPASHQAGPASAEGKAGAVVVASRVAGHGELRVLSGARPALSQAVAVEGLLGVSAAPGEVLAVRAAEGRAEVLTFAWDGKALSPSGAIRLDVRGTEGGTATVTPLEGTPPPLLVRLEGAGEDVVVLVKRPRGSPTEAIEIGARRGGGPVFAIGTRLVWVESHGTVLAAGVVGGKTAPPSLPRLSPTPTALERAQDLLDLGLPDEALAGVDRVLGPLQKSWDGRTQSRPIAEALLVRAHALAARGDLDGAFESLDRAEKASPQDVARALRVRADLLLAAGRRDGAGQALERLLLKGGLAEGDAERVRREISLVSAWSGARSLVDERLSGGSAGDLRERLLATDPLRVRIDTAGLVVHQARRRPVAAGVPLHLDGHTFEAGVTLGLPSPTEGAWVEWGLFSAGWDLAAGARAEGPGPRLPGGYRWRVRVPGAGDLEEAGLWPLAVAPRARVSFSYESRSRRAELRIESEAGTFAPVVWAGELPGDFPAGEYRLGVRVSASGGIAEGMATVSDLSFRAATLACSTLAPSGPSFERACGKAAVGDTADAVGLLAQGDPPTTESRAGLAALLAGATDPARVVESVSQAVAADRAGAIAAVADALPALPRDGAVRLIDALAAAWGGGDLERKAAAREALHRGDPGAAVAAIAPVAAAKGAEAEWVVTFARALLDLGQPGLAVEQALRVLGSEGGVASVGPSQQGDAVALLWEAWLRVARDRKLEEILVRVWPRPVVMVGKVEAGGAADRAGLRQGDRILSVDQAPLHLLEQFEEDVDRARCAGRGGLDLRVLRNGQSLQIPLPVTPLGTVLECRWVREGE